MNKKLIYIICLLLPITIISFFKKETNFIMPKKEEIEETRLNVKTSEGIINIELEEYIIGVVAGEMPALFEKEALKAQAIAARTYAINYLKNNPNIKSTTDNQVYLTNSEMHQKWQEDYPKYYNKIKDCVLETKGLIMYYEDMPIKAYYYAMSNGYTESSLNAFNEETEYLNIIPSPFDEDNQEISTISKETFCQKLNINCQNISIQNIKKNESNRIYTIEINSKKFTGLEIRELLGLRSTDFTIKILNNNIEITTKGYGHGVGMSQYGANNMAKEGYHYDEILKYYYQNIEIASI